MLNRRNFLKNAVAAGSATSLLLVSNPIWAQSKRLDKIGIQLFSLPKLLDKDFSAAIKLLAQIGYKEVELYGPYPFSTKAARERWNKVTPSLGFKGSGFFGHSVQQVAQILAQNGLSATSLHTDLDTLQQGMDKLGEAAHVLGSQYVILPSIPEEKRQTLDDYKRMADAFNAIGEGAKKAGIKFAYHNHGYGLTKMDGQIPLNLILERTNPDLVFFEMDVYWTTAGGADPIAYLKAYPNRYHLMHLKDMAKKVRFSGDGGNSKQWIELFPYMTTAGSGVLDLKSIITQAQKSGVRHFIVEQDMVADPNGALRKSFDYLASL